MSSSEFSSCDNSSGESSDEESQASYHGEVEEKDRNTKGDVGAFDSESHEAALDSLQTAGPYSDEPIASELWMQEYNVHRQEAEKEGKKIY